MASSAENLTLEAVDNTLAPGIEDLNGSGYSLMAPNAMPYAPCALL
ncbi:MAG: hypothetical protein JRF72_16615 [Deltaproteobacteria bacterium]|nr:hypothetical protein [Deltaproteobacteria bacterium]